MRPQCKDIDVVLVGLRSLLAVLLPDDVLSVTPDPMQCATFGPVPLMALASYHLGFNDDGILTRWLSQHQNNSKRQLAVSSSCLTATRQTDRYALRSRSSLFVSQETGQAIKKIWDALIFTEMFGPIKV